MLQFTYWTDVSGVQFNESTEQWVHALPIGEYDHPVFGKLKFDTKRIRRFADSVNQKVRGIDPDIDYDHKTDPSKGKAAAGWVKQAEERSDGLWLLVEWTESAANAISKKEYRYFSTEFAKEWKDGKGKKFTDVVLGGGLTNRPFIKDLVPINLSEIMQEDVMDRAKLIKLLKLSEDATDEQIEQAINKLSETEGDNVPEIDLSKLNVSVSDEGKIVVKTDDKEATFEVELPKAKEKEDVKTEEELAKLAENNPALQVMLSEHQQMKDDMRTLQQSARLSEVSAQLKDLGGEKKALPPVVQDKFRALMVKLPVQLSEEVHSALVELMKVGTIELGEKTATKPPEVNNDDVVKFLSEIDKLREKDDKLSYRDAYEEVRLSDPELCARYEEAIKQGYELTE